MSLNYMQNTRSFISRCCGSHHPSFFEDSSLLLVVSCAYMTSTKAQVCTSARICECIPTGKHTLMHIYTVFQGNIHKLWATNRISLLSVNGVQTTKLSLSSGKAGCERD